VTEQDAFFTNAEVFQELLHRYLALRMWSERQRDFYAYASLMAGRIEPMLAEDVELAGRLADRYNRLSARDLIHVAVMQRVGATHIVSADAAFDDVSEIERLDPVAVEEWRERVLAG